MLACRFRWKIIMRKIGWERSYRKVAYLASPVLRHPFDIVQLEHMISVDCLQ